MNERHRAVSEVIGYVIILGIVFTVFGLVFFNATSVFTTTEESESIENAQRGFIVLQSNVDDVVFSNTPRRTTDVQLGGGSVSVGGSQVRTVLSINGTEVSNRTLSSVRYSLRDRGISYENGAVIRESVSGSAMASEPGWVVREEMVTVPGVRTLGGGSVGGEGVVGVRTEETGRSFKETFGESEKGNVTLEIFSENSAAWEGYLEGLNRTQTGTVVDVTRTPNNNKVEVKMEIGKGQTFLYVEKPILVRLR